MRLVAVLLDGPANGQQREFADEEFDSPPHEVAVGVDGVDHIYRLAPELTGVIDEYERPEQLIRSYRWVDPAKDEVPRAPET
jgi:hypothetical protein